MGLEDLADVGELEKRDVGWDEIKGLIAKARRKLKDAKAENVSPETRLEQAYNVILTCAIIALRVAGYRVLSRTSAHYTAIATLRETLRLGEDKIDYYQTLRVLRHRDIYEATMLIDMDDLEEAVKEAQYLLELLESWVPKNFKS